MKTCYIVPMKENSSLQHKNRLLFPFLIRQFKMAKINPYNVYVYSDDNVLVEMAQNENYNCIYRYKELSKPETPIKRCLENIFMNTQFKKYDNCMLLYATYPLRTGHDILKITNFFNTYEKKSLVTIKQVIGKCTPARMLDSSGKPIFFNKDIVNRQDFPVFYERCGYIIMFKISELINLNNSLYNDDTFFYEIDRNKATELDIDTEEDLIKFMKILAV